MASKRDYYEVLGVGRSADAEAIKGAYRKLARQYHPDVNKSDDASARFAEVQEAYDALSDPEKRKAYDRFGHDGPAGAGFGGVGGGGRGRGTYTWTNVAGSPGGGAAGFTDSDIGSIFEEIFGVSGSRGGFGVRSPYDTASASHARARSKPFKGRDIEHDVTVSFEEAIRGGTQSIKVLRGGTTQTIEVTIPAGVAEGAKLRVRGAGAPSTGGGSPGDLILNIRIRPDEVFRREGQDLILDLPLTITEATLGATVNVPTLDKRVSLKVPAGTQSGQRLRVKGHGVRTADGKAGDLYAVVKIVPPKQLSGEDRAALERMGERLPRVRTGPQWGE